MNNVPRWFWFLLAGCILILTAVISAKLRFTMAGGGAVYDTWTRSLCVPRACIPMHATKTPIASTPVGSDSVAIATPRDPLAARRRREMDRALDSIRKVGPVRTVRDSGEMEKLLAAHPSIRPKARSTKRKELFELSTLSL